jgi:CubicO group peptidase (beta-lactamase class C family)
MKKPAAPPVGLKPVAKSSPAKPAPRAAGGYEARLLAAIGKSWQGATPGLRLQVHERGRLRADLALGKTYPFYDWASLTKIVFTVTAAMRAIEEKRIALAEPASRRLRFFAAGAASRASVAGVRAASRATVARLLSHSAGLAWWEHFYERIDISLPRDQRWAQMRELLAASIERSAAAAGPHSAGAAGGPAAAPGGIASPPKAVYSDLDFISLGFILNEAYQAPLLEIWAETRERLRLDAVDFHPDNQPIRARAQYAPTEVGGFRVGLPLNLAPQWGEGGALQGEVHDENAWALGGVAPHSGLFGDLAGLTRYGLALRKALMGDRVSGFPKPETVQRFARRAVPQASGDWALGFMLPARHGSSAGRYFSPRSIGHTGFTGTSLWLDPRRDLLVTILSNRVCPTRENKMFVELRGRLHNWCVESI